MTSIPFPPRSSAGDEPALGTVPTARKPDRQAGGEPAGQVEIWPVRTILIGLGGMSLVALGGVGAAAVLVPEPLLNGTPMSWVGYGHGKDLATAVLYIGLGLLVWAWLRLGRDVRAGQTGSRSVLLAIGVWALPMLLAPPLFSRDLYSYLAQGDLSLHGLNPYTFGVSVLNDQLSANVDPIWSNTPTPYGPLFILAAKFVVAITGQNTVLGVISMRLVMCAGMVLLCWALPRLAVRLGGSPPIALWFAAANPLVLVYLIGGGHNDLLMIGLLAAGTVLVVDGRHAKGFAVVTLAFAVKATAVVLLPFLVWIWAARLTGSARIRFVKAAGAGVAIVVPVFALCSVAAWVDLGWIPALSTSNIVVEWLSIPTAVAQAGHAIAAHFDPALDLQVFLKVARLIGWLVLTVLVARQWWRARSGAVTTTLRRAAVALLIVTVFSPATLPWYFSWSLVMAAGFAWTDGALVLGTFVSVCVLLSTYPTGATALYHWGYLAIAVVAAAIAALSLLRPALPLPRPAVTGLEPLPRA